MKKSRIIALLTAVAMIMSVVPAYAGYFVDDEGSVFEKSGENLVSNPGFEEGLAGLTENDEYYEVSSEHVHSGAYSLKAIKSTKGDGAITAYFPVEDADDSYYLSFWYKNTDEVARRPRVTFAFTDSSKAIPTEEDEFTELTNAWVQAGTSSNDQDMAYSNGEWVQYSTVINGTGDSGACKYVVLNIYGLTKNVSYVDDFEVYALSYSDEYGDAMAEAIEEWSNNSIPGGPLAGVGTLDLPREVEADGILVEWTSTDADIINSETGSYISGAEEALVILTARLYAEGLHDEVYFEFTYPYIVKSMFEPYINWVQEAVFTPMGSAISGNLALPATHSIAGYPEAEIEWSCSEEGILAPDGTYTAPEVTCYVEVIATITCSGASATTSKRVKAIGGNLIPDGLEMYYDFETPIKSSKVYDNAQKAYNATADGVTIVNGYASINGTIILPNDYPSKLRDSYSVSMWVRLNESITSSAGMYRFFDFGGGSYTSQFLRYIPADNQLTFMDRELAESGSNWAIDTTAEIGKTGWSLVTLTYDMESGSSAYVRAFVDGVEVGNSTGCTYLTRSIYQMNSSSNTGFIGQTQWDNADNPDLYGWIDDVRIYSRVLEDEEILTLFEETKPIVTAPVTIKFQDSEGKTLKDDVTVQAEVNLDYDVPASYKSLPSTSDGSTRYVYNYVASKSIDSVSVSADGENVCILVFQMKTQAKGTNLLDNGSFENGTEGWTNRLGTAITGATVEYDESIGANVMKIATQGKSSTQNIGTVWNVEKGKKYNISFDIYTGEVLDAGNYQYNRLSDAYALGDVGQRENSGTDIIAWGAGLTANAWSHFEESFTAATDTLYFQSSWSAGEMKFANFSLEEVVSQGGNDEPDENAVPVILKFVDTEGNKIAEDVTTSVKSGTQKYTVPSSYMMMEDEIIGGINYKYTYVGIQEDEGEAEPDNTIGISILRDNVATLVFNVMKTKQNLVTDGGFKDADGNFSWGTWETTERQAYLKDVATNEDWFYKVDRDTNSSVYSNVALTADDYAIGTRWNDGTNGLCTLSNFIPVKKGKTYVVSYDYKHRVAGTNASSISTDFVATKNYAANPSGKNIPKNVSTDWQTNTFIITAPSDGYIYFHFSWLGSGGSTNTGENSGGGPHWYFDNFSVNEVITFENKITYSAGYAEIVAEDGTEGYLVQAMYNEDGALTDVAVSDKLTLSQETATRVEVKKGAKLMLVKDLTSLEPLAPAIMAE